MEDEEVSVFSEIFNWTGSDGNLITAKLDESFKEILSSQKFSFGFAVKKYGAVKIQRVGKGGICYSKSIKKRPN